jgi:hypothetical protein
MIYRNISETKQFTLDSGNSTKRLITELGMNLYRMGQDCSGKNKEKRMNTADILQNNW